MKINEQMEAQYSSLTRRERQLMAKHYPELCGVCWECDGTGKAISCGHLADCLTCLGIGKTVDSVKVIRKMLEEKGYYDNQT